MSFFAIPRGRNLQYAVIGRLKKEHDAYGLDPDQIKEIIAEELIGYISASDVSYVAPNFIICNDSPQAQRAILMQPTMETNYFQLQMVPWSREHELAQLPWITVTPTEGSTIKINPLQILPVTSKKSLHQGPPQLMDTFASQIPRAYDLRSPDLSYLLITELKHFYKQKFEGFIDCKRIASALRSAVTNLMKSIKNELTQIIGDLKSQVKQQSIPAAYKTDVFINNLNTAFQPTEASLPYLYELIDASLLRTETPLNLQGFTDGPPPIKMPVPCTYAQRLKVIYDTAIQKIHSVHPIIETIEREKDRYETYITVGNFTRRYFGGHTKNAPAMEAAAVYYALKHLTNVQGYSIIDLNYPILHTLVSDIDGWNMQLNSFQIFTNRVSTLFQNAYNEIRSLCQSGRLSELEPNDLSLLQQTVNKFTNKVEEFHTSIGNLCQDFNACKEMYQHTHIDMYSPTRSYYHWGRAKRPKIT